MSITTQLLENPDCDTALLLNGVQVTSSSRFESNGDGQFCRWQLDIPAGGYRLTVAYQASDGPIRVRYGSAHQDLPEAAGGNVVVLGLSLAAAEGAVIFDDLGDARTRLARVDLRPVT